MAPFPRSNQRYELELVAADTRHALTVSRHDVIFAHNGRALNLFLFVTMLFKLRIFQF